MLYVYTCMKLMFVFVVDIEANLFQRLTMPNNAMFFYSQNAELRQQCSKLQTELEEAVKQREESIAKEQAARTDSSSQVRLPR